MTEVEFLPLATFKTLTMVSMETKVASGDAFFFQQAFRKTFLACTPRRVTRFMLGGTTCPSPSPSCFEPKESLVGIGLRDMSIRVGCFLTVVFRRRAYRTSIYKICIGELSFTVCLTPTFPSHPSPRPLSLSLLRAPALPLCISISPLF